MELYTQKYQQLTDTTYLVMQAKTAKSFMANSKKLSHVHISPVEIEDNGSYKMQLSHSGSRCMRLVFTKGYSQNQTKAMYSEIRQLASAKLAETRTEDSDERRAFDKALEFLTTIGE